MGTLLDLALTASGLREQVDSTLTRVPSPRERQRGSGSSTANAAESRVAEMTREFAVELRLGCIVVCKGCTAFQARPGEAPDGWCRRYSVETWSRVPFQCDGYRGVQ